MALEGPKSTDCDQFDGNLLRSARFRHGTAEQCFAPDSRIGVSLFLKADFELRDTFELCGARASSIPCRLHQKEKTKRAPFGALLVFGGADGN